MKMGLFRKDPSREAGEALYAAAVKQARAAPHYAEFGVPDTVEGRFEMVALHVYLILRRLKDAPPPAGKVGQRLFDAMFQDLDDCLRELGVGDLSIARKIRALAENFYGRVGAYEDALKDGAPPDALASALARNVYEDEEAEHAAAFAQYVRQAVASFSDQTVDDLTKGRAVFPTAGRAS